MLNKKYKKIIYASSSSVYKDSGKKIFNECSSRLGTKNPICLSKLANESYASKIAKTDISIVGLRFFSVYGPWGRPDMAYFLFANQLKNEKNNTK